MPLTEEQNETIKEHLRDSVSGGCPVCGGRNWTILPDLGFTGTMDAEYKQPIQGKIYPVVVVVCQNCHFMLQFGAKALGVLD